MNEFNHIVLVDSIKQIEEARLQNNLKKLEDHKTGFLKEILHEKHLARVAKNHTKREV